LGILPDDSFHPNQSYHHIISYHIISYFGWEPHHQLGSRWFPRKEALITIGHAPKAN
jgi:hypothetical protein